MIIKRNGIDIELTQNELFQAFKEQQFLFMFDYVQQYCDLFYNFTDTELYTITEQTLECLTDFESNDEQALLMAIDILKHNKIL